MKNLKYIIVLILTGFLFSCEDFLDKQPLDQLSSETFWKTEKDADMGLAGVYKSLQTEQFGGMIYTSSLAHWDALTDNGWAMNSFEGYFQEVAKGEMIASSNLPRYLWNSCYKGISACNVFLENIGTVETSNEAVYITQYTAEVRFIRAYFYYWLSQCFGGVPLVLESPTVENMKRPRSTKEQVLEKIYDDLDYAIANLPDIAYSGYGHAVKGSAQALKARVKLFNGNYAEAASIAKQIIDNGKFSLAPDYNSNFVIDYGQDNCPEVIFSIQYLGPDNPQHTGGNLNWGGSVQPFPAFVECHEPGDKRLKDNILSPGDPWPFKSLTATFTGEGLFAITGYAINKYYSPSFGIELSLVGRGEDMPQLRYAEVLLVYAEAQNEASGPDGTVYDAINQVRVRSELDPLPTGLSKDEMREKIRHERRVELAFEGHRYFDLKRWGIIGDIMPTLPDPPNSTDTYRKWDDHFMLFPIPQNEIDKDPTLEQNPGYL